MTWQQLIVCQPLWGSCHAGNELKQLAHELYEVCECPHGRRVDPQLRSERGGKRDGRGGSKQWLIPTERQRQRRRRHCDRCSASGEQRRAAAGRRTRVTMERLRKQLAELLGDEHGELSLTLARLATD